MVSVLAAAEWLRADGAPGWAVLAVMAAVVATVAAVVSRPRRTVDVVAAVAALVVGGVVGRAALEIREIECCWPALRERRLTAASEALGARLERAVRDARRLANAGVDAATLERREAFAALARAPSARGAEQGVAVLAPGGEPWVWAGRHRVITSYSIHYTKLYDVEVHAVDDRPCGDEEHDADEHADERKAAFQLLRPKRLQGEAKRFEQRHVRRPGADRWPPGRRAA